MRPILGVNVDHVATLRQARRAAYPDPVAAALLCEIAGAQQITVHLRMDRRHIQDRDIELLARSVQTRLNVEMAASEEMLDVARRLRPQQVTLVPERRGEVTTEGGLDLCQTASREPVALACAALREARIDVSIFVDPDPEQVDAVLSCGARTLEFNTAAYSDARDEDGAARERERVAAAARRAVDKGLRVAAGHGLSTLNLPPLVALGLVEEFNIGHSIVARAVFVGIDRAVRDILDVLRG
jgi:pyridoxine 5-phosphate synthase